MTHSAPADGAAAAAFDLRRVGIRAAIIDLDGTMVDTLGDFVVALGATLDDLGLPPVDAGFVRASVGKGSKHLLRATLAAVGGDEARLDEAWSHYQRHYRRINGQHAEVYPGVESGLQRLAAAGIALGCLTNKPGEFARALLERKGLARHFAVIFGGDAFERQKPDPLPVQRTCEALGAVPRDVLVVGDSVNDAESARAAGCRIALVDYGYNHGRPVRDTPADVYLGSLDALMP